MRNLLWLVAAICIAVWILGILGTVPGNASDPFFYVLIAIAVIAIFYNVISGKKEP